MTKTRRETKKWIKIKIANLEKEEGRKQTKTEKKEIRSCCKKLVAKIGRKKAELEAMAKNNLACDSWG